MIPSVSFGTLCANVTTVNVSKIIQLTARTKIVRFDGKRASASFTVFTGASCRDTVISCGTTIAFRAHRVMFTCLKKLHAYYFTHKLK